MQGRKMQNKKDTLSEEDIKEGRKVLLAILLLVVVIPLMIYLVKKSIDYEYTKDFSIKKEAFLKNEVLECNVWLSTKSYLVSQGNGWTIHKDYFRKDDARKVGFFECEDRYIFR